MLDVADTTPEIQLHVNTYLTHSTASYGVSEINHSSKILEQRINHHKPVF